MGKQIKFGIIGYGRIGQRHQAIIDGHPDCQLVTVCDVQEEVLKSVSAPISTFTDISAQLAGSDPFDVLSIATPNGLHAQHAIAGLRAGKHVVIEKPMGLSRKECEQVLFEALQQDRQVFCVMQNRYSPPSVWLKELLQSKKLGQIHKVLINCYWNRDGRYYQPGSWHGSLDLDGGTLFTQFSHFIDMMFWLFGDVTNIQAKFSNLNHKDSIQFEDTGQIMFDFEHGGVGSFNYSTSVWDQNLESSMTIIGECGSVKVSGQYMNEVVHCHINNYVMPELAVSAPPNDYGGYQGSAANHHYVYQNVVDTLKGTGHIATNALEGMKVVDIIERMYQHRVCASLRNE